MPKPQLQQDLDYSFSSSRGLKSRIPAAKQIYSDMGSKGSWNSEELAHLTAVTRCLYATLYKRFPTESKRAFNLSKMCPNYTTTRFGSKIDIITIASAECIEVVDLLKTFDQGTGKEHVPALLQKLHDLHTSLISVSSADQVLNALRQATIVSTMGQIDSTRLMGNITNADFVRTVGKSVSDLRDSLLLHLCAGQDRDGAVIDKGDIFPCEEYGNIIDSTTFSLKDWSELPQSWRKLGEMRSRIVNDTQSADPAQVFETINKEAGKLNQQVVAAMRDVGYRMRDRRSGCRDSY